MLRALFLFVALAAFSSASLGASELFRVAFFDVDASPPIGSPMAYNPTIEITSPLRCRGIILIGDAKPIVLCAVDWIAISNESQQVFRDQFAQAAGTSADRVSVHVLHQHDAPYCDFTTDRLAEEQGVVRDMFDSPFARDVIRRAADAIQVAVKSAVEITHIGLGEGVVEQVASNRRILGPDGKVKSVRYTASTDPQHKAAPEGVIDKHLKSIAFWNGDRRIVELTYYATHPQSYYRNGKANPDFPGMARDRRQSATGVPHVHFDGAGGNIGAGKYNDGSVPMREVLVQRVMEGMAKAWENEQRIPVTSKDLGWNVVAVALPASPHLDEQKLVATLTNKDRAPRERSLAATELAWLKRCQRGDKIDIGCLSIGKARVLHLPGELFVEYQLAAQQMRPDCFVAMAAYGDCGMWYVGTEIAYEQGGYETQPTSSLVAPQVEGVLIGAMRTLLDSKVVFPERLGTAAAREEIEFAKSQASNK